MIDALMKVCGALFVGGIGLLMIVIATLVITVLIKEVIEKYNRR